MSYAMEAELIQRINSQLLRIQDLINRMADAINEGLRWLPSWIARQVQENWAEFLRRVDELWQTMRTILARAGSPSTLRDTASSWSTQVGGPVSALSGMASSDQSQVNRYWEGEAASAYLETLPPQRRAIDHINTAYAVPISNTLSAMATAIVVFWSTIVGALVVLIGGLLGALAAKGTVVGIPAGIVAAIAAVGVFLAGVFTAREMLTSSASSENNSLLQQLHDDSALPGGAWPRSTIG